MRIGIDCHLLGKSKGGSELVLRKILEYIPGLLPNYEFVLFVSKKFDQKDYSIDFPSNVILVRWPLENLFLQRIFLAPVYMFFLKLDLFHIQRLLPFIRPCKTILTIHDLLPITHPQKDKGLNHWFVRYFTRYSAKYADSILTGSKIAQKEIADFCSIPPQNIHVCYNGIDLEKYSKINYETDKPSLKSNFGISDDYLLYFGPIVERKNINVLIQAYNLWRKSSSQSALLVIAGIIRSTNCKDNLLKLIDQSPFKNDMHFLGQLADNDAIMILRNATLFFAPSSGEGFDLPPIEAMASGVPVICSDIEVHRELFNGCAVFYETDSADALSRSISECWNAEQKCLSLVKSAFKRINQFSWKHMAAKVAYSYSQILNGNYNDKKAY